MAAIAIRDGAALFLTVLPTLEASQRYTRQQPASPETSSRLWSWTGSCDRQVSDVGSQVGRFPSAARRSLFFAVFLQAAKIAAVLILQSTLLVKKLKGRMKSRSSSLPLASPASRTEAGSSIDKDTKRGATHFSDLLQAASCSPGESTELWPSDNLSTSETDEDDENEHYDEAEDVATDNHSSMDNAGNLCRSSGCPNGARSRGLCPAHGGGTRCRAQDCSKHVVSGGLCVAHGGGRQCRGSPSCTSSAVSRGLCVQHGGGRKCYQTGCNKHVASGGLCRKHGGGRRCQVPDCTSSAQSRGLCYVHGGGGRCQQAGCGSSAKKGGLCIAHGGGHRCQVEGCTSSAVSGARCRAHGGGRRCGIEGCTSSAKTGGRCIAHGGGKRCTVDGCTSSAQRLGLCKAHGGGRRCVVEGCGNSAVSRGRCIAHGGGKRCVFEGCTTTARKGGFCFAHGGRSSTSTARSRTKMSSPIPSMLTTPETTYAKSNPWSMSEARSPIPALSLPPRRLLPPINTMLMANRPGILRRYTPLPPIRSPAVSLEPSEERASRSQNMFSGRWTGTFNPNSAGLRGNVARIPSQQRPSIDLRDQAPRTPIAPSSRAGYSWTRLQETIRRESRVHGITNEEDEEEYAHKATKDNQVLDDNTTKAGSGYYWTRSRGTIRS